VNAVIGLGLTVGFKCHNFKKANIISTYRCLSEESIGRGHSKKKSSTKDVDKPQVLY